MTCTCKTLDLNSAIPLYTIIYYLGNSTFEESLTEFTFSDLICET